MVNKPVLWWDSLSHHCRNLLNRTCKLFNRGIQLWAVLLFFTLHPTLPYSPIYGGGCANRCYSPPYSTLLSDLFRLLCYSVLLSILLYSNLRFMEVAVLLFFTLPPALLYFHIYGGGCATLCKSPPFSILPS